MKSPFPGMDPYIESSSLWADFHGHLIEKIAERLAEATPARYLVRTGERSYLVLIESEGKAAYPFLPDVTVTTPARAKKPSRKRGGTAVAEPPPAPEPLVLRAFIEEEHRERFVEIYEATPEQRLVTTIEILSPSNKRPNTPGWDQYQRKRQSLLLGGVSLVEIDLLRGGQRMPMLDPWPASPYTLTVARANKPHACLVWPAHFREPLTPVPVPLAKPDPDVRLELQPLIDGIYERHRYAQSIDYRNPPDPPLSPQEVTWLQGRLRERQRGTGS